MYVSMFVVDKNRWRAAKLTRSTQSPKLPLVSYSRIRGIPSSLFRLQTLILPFMLVLARYWPSALSAIAHISPGLFWSATRSAHSGSLEQHFLQSQRKHEAYPPTISPSSLQTPSSSWLHILTLPSKPALAARLAFSSRAVTRWCIPSGCALSSVCITGNSACVVS
ncbi:WD repeat-containing protein 61 [Alternaria alternata]|nr:WD repeat-containing protein 61 [Alternaria alternata]